MSEETNRVELCMCCSSVTVKGDRRKIAGSTVVLSFWKSILVSELNIVQSVVEEIVKLYQFMCRSCFYKFETCLQTYENLISSVK